MVATGCAVSSEEPILEELTPGILSNAHAVPVMVRGSSFFVRTITDIDTGEGALDDIFEVVIASSEGAEVSLDDVVYIDASTLSATVPSGLEAGWYDAWVVGPHGRGITVTQAIEIYSDLDDDQIDDEEDPCVDVDLDGLGRDGFDTSGCSASVFDTDDDDPNLCADTDQDGCDDCSSGGFAPSLDGVDDDGDGFCSTLDCDDNPLACGADCSPALEESSSAGNCDDSYDNDCDGASDAFDSECWWIPSWTRRMRLTFDNAARGENLDDFAVLVRLDGSKIDYASTRDAGEDLRFLDADQTTVLAHEIESWDEGGVSTVWVKVPRIDASSADDHIWLYYGDDMASDAQDATAVWSNGYAGVWHMAQSPPALIEDSIGNSSASSNGGLTATNQVGGQMDGAIDFDGVNDYLSATPGGVFDLAGDITLSAWVFVDSWSTSWPRILHYNSPSSQYVLALTGNGPLAYTQRTFWAGTDVTNNYDAQAPTDSISLGTWTYIAAVFDSTNNQWSLYKNAQLQVNSDADDVFPGDTQLSFGARSVSGVSDEELSGVIDEIRVTNGSRSAAWIDAQYASMTDTLITYGPEENI